MSPDIRDFIVLQEELLEGECDCLNKIGLKLLVDTFWAKVLRTEMRCVTQRAAPLMSSAEREE
jgi:hypothetical protein